MERKIIFYQWILLLLHDWIDMKLKIDSVRFEGNISIGRFQFQLKMLGYYRLSSSYAD